MRVEKIEIHAGPVDFPFQAIRKVEVECEAPTALSKPLMIEGVNIKLRELAREVGANAVVDVTYDSGPSWTSWRLVRGHGVAVRKESEDRPCPVCAETVKRAAKKCQFCGADLPELAARQQAAGGAPSTAESTRASVDTEPPLRATNNSIMWIVVVIGAVLLLGLLGSLS
jgi:hypothetical protein